jgi:hypothetical protein
MAIGCIIAGVLDGWIAPALSAIRPLIWTMIKAM